MFAKPGHSQYQALLAQFGDGEEDALRVSLIGHEDVDYPVNAASFIERSIDIVHRDRHGQATCRQLSTLDEFFVDEVASRAGVDHGFGVDLLHCVRGFKVDQDHDTSWAFLKRIQDEPGVHSLLPSWSTASVGGHRGGGVLCWLCVFTALSIT